MTHIAIQEALDSKVVDWLEKVSDAPAILGLSGKDGSEHYMLDIVESGLSRRELLARLPLI
jgi:hypothetical protein